MKTLRLSRDRKKLEDFLARRETKLADAVRVVEKICREIRANGDKSLLKYIKRFDSWPIKTIPQIKVTRQEIREAYREVDKRFLESLRLAKANVEDFHGRQKKGRETWHEEKGGLMIGEQYSSLEKVGVYVPGGRACYPSTALMNIIPAKVAGVREVTVTTPPSHEGSINPYVLVSADMAGASRIFKVGGAQAIAAMAFGTKTIAGVDKIVGPGNMYVAAAKLVVQQETSVGIDMLAGPTEIMIIADEKARTEFVVADMLSQAEHGSDSIAIVVTTSEGLAKDIPREIGKQMKKLKRFDVIEACLRENGLIIIAGSIDESIELANSIAPEHLELQVGRPWECMQKVKNAGAVFLGDYTPGCFGDYLAGPNHVLPTGGRARFSSPLGIDDFMKKTNFVFSDRTELRRLSDAVERFAECEGFDAHAEAIRIRMRGRAGQAPPLRERRADVQGRSA